MGSLLTSAESTLAPPRSPSPRSSGTFRVAEAAAKSPTTKANTDPPAIDIASRFAANVAKAREQLRMSVRTLAERAGISVWYVRRIESAAQVPTLRVAEQIAVALDVPLASLHTLARPYASR